MNDCNVFATECDVNFNCRLIFVNDLLFICRMMKLILNFLHLTSSMNYITRFVPGQT